MPKKDDTSTTESEVTLLADDELDAVAGGKTEGGKPAPGKQSFEALFRQKRAVGLQELRTLIFRLRSARPPAGARSVCGLRVPVDPVQHMGA